MPGAGKALASTVAREMGKPVLVMGDIVRKETVRRGLALNPENVGAVMLSLRQEFGMAAIAQLLRPLAESESSDLLIVEGVRNYEEIEEFWKYADVIVLAIHASPAIRYRRLLERKRSDDPRTKEQFEERDKRELRVGIGNVIALADKMILNEGSPSDFKERVMAFLKELDQN